MTPRKQLMLEIAALEKKLLSHKIEHYQHKKYLAHFVEENNAVLLAILVPAFLIGWHTGKKKNVTHIGKQLTNLVVLTAVTNVRKKLWNTFAKIFFI